MKITFNILYLFLIFYFLFFISPPAYAANTIIGISPNTGTYTAGNAFTVSIVIDGHGDNFNAAKATVNIPSSLNVNNITLGDCNFAFVTTPTTSNPSFAGVIFGGSSKKCTVYSLNLLPLFQGPAAITISNAEVKAYPTAADTLIGLQNSNFNISPSVAPFTPPPTAYQLFAGQQTSGNTDSSPYTITIKAESQNNTPLSGAIVVLDQNQNHINQPVSPSPSTLKSIPTQSFSLPLFSPQESKTDINGTAQFNNVQPGIHTAAVLFNNKLIGKTIINAWGPQHTITLGIKAQKPQFPLLIVIMIATGFVGVLTLVFFLLRYKFL